MAGVWPDPVPLRRISTMTPIYRRHRRLLVATLAVLLVADAGSACAQLPDPYEGRNEWNPTDMEVAQLPPYCQANLRPKVYRGPGTQAYDCGESFNHFCPALVAINRSSSPLLPIQARRFNLQLAEDHLKYTRGHWASTCRLAAQVQAAENQVRMLRIVLK